METLQNITLGDVLKYSAIALSLLGIFFEITPIKFNPISMALGWLGKRLNRDLSQKVDKQGRELDEFKREMQEAMELNQQKFVEHEKTEDMYEINRMRYEILDFSNACQNHRKHTSRQFAHILSLYIEYEKLIAKWGMTNGEVDQEIAYIKELDLQCKRENSYLPDYEQVRRGGARE